MLVTLNIGDVIDVTKKCDADGILLVWQEGLVGGTVIADIVSGKVNPSVKLCTTSPARYEDELSD